MSVSGCIRRRVVFGVLGLLFSALVFGTGFEPPSPADIEGLAPELRERIETLAASIRSQPDDVDALSGLAQTCEAAGLMDWAEQAYRESLRLDPEAARLHHFLARLLERGGKLDEAGEAYSAVRRLAPDYAPAYVLHADLLVQQGRFDEGEVLYREARKRDSEDGIARHGIARLALRRKDSATVIALLEPLLGTNRADRGLVQTLARAYQMDGRAEEARQAMANIAAIPVRRVIDPWNDSRPQFLAGFGVDLLKSERLANEGHFGEAIAILEDLHRSHPDNLTVINNLAVVCRRDGRTERSLELMLQGVERFPDYFPLHMNLATYYESRQENGPAARHLRRVIELHPELAIAHERLGAILMRAQNFQAAYDSYDRAATLGDRSHASLFAGQLALRLGDTVEAIKHL
ncbi:MAG: tetratricopeptide repeat protein, partial [Acidobacteriota bacterium]|nr:tetratricopeptide repeat protein [Acidobacteriota bacterium]